MVKGSTRGRENIISCFCSGGGAVSLVDIWRLLGGEDLQVTSATVTTTNTDTCTVTIKTRLVSCDLRNLASPSCVESSSFLGDCWGSLLWFIVGVNNRQGGDMTLPASCWIIKTWSQYSLNTISIQHFTCRVVLTKSGASHRTLPSEQKTGKNPMWSFRLASLSSHWVEQTLADTRFYRKVSKFLCWSEKIEVILSSFYLNVVEPLWNNILCETISVEWQFFIILRVNTSYKCERLFFRGFNLMFE